MLCKVGAYLHTRWNGLGLGSTIKGFKRTNSAAGHFANGARADVRVDIFIKSYREVTFNMPNTQSHTRTLAP